MAAESPRGPTEIVLDGSHGAGKTTLALALALDGWTAIPEFVVPAPAVGFPTNEQEIFFANDIAKMGLAGAPLAQGRMVVHDRSWLSTVIYGYAIGGRAEGQRRLRWATGHVACGRLRVPDLALILTCDATATAERTKARANHRDIMRVSNQITAVWRDPPDSLRILIPSLYIHDTTVAYAFPSAVKGYLSGVGSFAARTAGAC